MDASASASWTRIPRDVHEQQRLQLEHRLFASSAHSTPLSDVHSSLNLEDDLPEEQAQQRGGMAHPGYASSSEFSIEFPRNPQVEAEDYSLSNRYRSHRHQPPDSDTKSTFAHHASAVTFRTGLRGPRNGRSRDISGGFSDMSIEYDPDRPLDALLRRASELSILQDSPREAQKSDFTSRAQGLAKQIEVEKAVQRAPTPVSDGDNSFAKANVTLKPSRKLYADLARNPTTPARTAFATAATRLFPAYTNATGRLHLPDVTGLTSAIATPMKADASYRRPPETKATIAAKEGSLLSHPAKSSGKAQPSVNPIAELDKLSQKLQQIERESLTSRRRVNELERELETCRSVVDVERSRMGELSMNTSRRRNLHTSKVGNSSANDRAKAEPVRRSAQRDKAEWEDVERMDNLDAEVLDQSFRETQRRYRDAVGEEKELEALVKALHSHLRQTSQTVESHRQAIDELRAESQRRAAPQRVASASDARAVTQVCEEVEHVKNEVEALWGDVGRLRDIVESGLGLRRARDGGVLTANEANVIAGSVIRDESLRDLSVADDADDASERSEAPADSPRQHEGAMEQTNWDHIPRNAPGTGGIILSAVLEEDEPPSTRASVRSPNQATSRSGRFVHDAELERVRAEVEERRSQRSASMSGSENSAGRLGIKGPAYSSNKLAGLQGREEGRSSPAPILRASTSKLPTGARFGLQQHTPPRPLTPESDAEVRRAKDQESGREGTRTKRPSKRVSEDGGRQRVVSPSTLPQIRGERLERLFYSAPEHNKKTCNVCHRRRRAEGSHKEPRRASASGSPDLDMEKVMEEISFYQGDKHRIVEVAKRNGLPPQTVLARVLRELEDDFTHYKSIYVELADQYKAMDAASDMGKRNLLANHLREVIDVLEQRGDQIASLYDLLHFEDKPLTAQSSNSRHQHKSRQYSGTQHGPSKVHM